jgi:hypothetical protein
MRIRIRRCLTSVLIAFPVAVAIALFIVVDPDGGAGETVGLVGHVLSGTVRGTTRRGWVDPVTGSTKTQTTSGLFSRRTVLERTALDEWVRRNEGAYSDRWVLLYERRESGGRRSYACSRPPAISERLGDSRSVAAFVAAATGRELGSFVRVMRTGTEAEQAAALSAASDLANSGARQQ